MPLYEYLCIDGTEVAHAYRATQYVRNRSSLGSVIFTVSSECFDCELVHEGDVYTDPATDDAPWYDPAVQASEEFLGIAPINMQLLSVNERHVTNLSRGGGIVGPLVPKPRTMTVNGMMFAYTAAGMQYGQRWLSEILAGQIGCSTGRYVSEVEFLPACPSEDTDTYDPDMFFRRLIDAACVDGPVFKPVTQGIPECFVTEVAFQLMAGKSQIYSPEIECMTDEPIGAYEDTTCCLVSTTDWTGDAVANVVITAQTDATDIVLTGTPTFDGQCPWDGNMPCWTITIPELPAEGIITVDSVRGEVRYRDPTLKADRSGVRMIQFEGPLTFPEIGPCSEFCICGTVGTGDVTMSVSKVIREF